MTVLRRQPGESRIAPRRGRPHRRSLNCLEPQGRARLKSCSAQGWQPGQLVKVLLLLAVLEDGQQQPMLVSLRGDQNSTT